MRLAAAIPKLPDGKVPVTEYVLLVALAATWGAALPFMKIAVATIPPFTAVAFRTMIAGAVLLAILKWRGIALPTDWGHIKSFLAVSLVNTVAPFILIAWGLKTVDAGLGVILSSTTPIFTFLITWGITRHEAVTKQKLFGVVVGMLGVTMIVGTSALSGLGQQVLPQLAFTLASVCYATSAIYGRTFAGLNPMVPAAGSLTVGGLIALPMAVVIDQPWTLSPSVPSVLALIGLGLFSTAFGNMLYFRLLGTLGSLSTTAQSYLRVPIGVMISMAMLGERLSGTAMIGLVCVLGAVVAMTMAGGRGSAGRK